MAENQNTSSTSATPASVATARADSASSTPTDVTTDGGRTVIEDNVVAKIAGIAAREVRGVHALGGGAARAIGALRNAFNNTDLTQGISVEVGERQAAVDVTIVAEYPVALQDVADNVRESIYDAIGNLVGLEVTEVNVTVTDVHIPSEDDKDDSDQQRREPVESRVQ